jgi:2-(1,2-epoxy-1,2-dihydrophenyl)acetyl-CoA isomerase
MESLEFKYARLEFDGALARITLNDPGRLNAISEVMALGIQDCLAEIAKPRRKVRAVLVTGEGRAFCAGANLGEGAERVSTVSKSFNSVESIFHPMVRRWRAIDVPVVAAVNGGCVGIGLALALLCDHIVAAEDAYFLVPYAKLGSSVDSSLSWLLPHTIGLARARQMIMRSDRVPAGRALDWGMINEVVPASSLIESAEAVAQEFVNGPTVALSLMRHLIAGSGERTYDQHLEAEAQGVRQTAYTRDNAAGMKAYAARTAPLFTGE